MSKEIETNKLIRRDFLEFVAKKTEKEYSMYQPLGDTILVRLYFFDATRYENEAKQKLYVSMTSDQSASAEIYSKLFSIGKVLALGTDARPDIKENLKPGDLIYLPEWITMKKDNPAFHTWEVKSKEAGSLANNPRPPEQINRIVEWKDHVFLRDRMAEDMTVHEAHTFLIPTRYVVAKHLENES